MTSATPPDCLKRIIELRNQIIVATSVLEQLQAAQEEALVEAVRWRKRLELAWNDRRFENWLYASNCQDHYLLKSKQLQQQVEQYTQQVETWKTELLAQEQQVNRVEQSKTLEQKFQQLLQLAQEALEDLKNLQAQV